MGALRLVAALAVLSAGPAGCAHARSPAAESPSGQPASGQSPSGQSPSGVPPVSGSPRRARAAPATPPSASRAPAGRSPAAATPAVRYAFPVPAARVSYGHVHALYPATDIMARCGSPVVSPADGVVAEVSRVDWFIRSRPDGAAKGGLFVSITGGDGVRYYSAHLSAVAPGLAPGTAVRAGTPIGAVGRSGNANNVCHVHFAISPPCARAGDWWIRRGTIYPWPYLDSWHSGGQRSPAAAVAAWRGAHGCGYPGAGPR
jgi:murein DD-endopeptidase MepM/ murein hydrolase activator NlpD